MKQIISKGLLALGLGLVWLPVTVVAQEMSSMSDATSTSEAASQASDNANETSSTALTVRPYNYGQRTAPVPLGQAYLVQTQSHFKHDGLLEPLEYQLSVKRVLRGEQALAQVKSWQSNTKPLENIGDNQELLLVELELQYQKGSETQAFSLNPMMFGLYNQAVKPVKQPLGLAIGVVPRDQGFETQMFPGNLHTGYLAFVAPKDEPVQLVAEPFFTKYFFNLD